MVSCDSFFSLYILLYSLLSEAFFFESQWRFKYRFSCKFKQFLANYCTHTDTHCHLTPYFLLCKSEKSK